jgi:hypothetical protein
LTCKIFDVSEGFSPKPFSVINAEIACETRLIYGLIITTFLSGSFAGSVLYRSQKSSKQFSDLKEYLYKNQ